MTNYHTNPSGIGDLIVFPIYHILFYTIWKLVLFFRFQRHIWSTGLVMFWKLCLMTATWIQLCTRCVYLRATKIVYGDKLMFNIPVNCKASDLKWSTDSFAAEIRVVFPSSHWQRQVSGWIWQEFLNPIVIFWWEKEYCISIQKFAKHLALCVGFA